MSQLQQLQAPIDQAILHALLGCLPPAWTKAVLEAHVVGDGASGTRMSLRIDGCGQPGAALVDDGLQASVRELFLLNSKFRTELQGIRYDCTRDARDGNWRFDAEYEYA
jgi:hypothetical protein